MVGNPSAKTSRAAKAPSVKRAAAKTSVAKEASAKKASAKKASAKKTVAKTTATKAVAKKTEAKKAIATAAPRTSAVSEKASKAKAPTLLAGGNPQIAKGHGDAPVQAYIAAMPGWKRDAGQRLDALIERAVPGVRKAVKWNSPLYGAKDDAGWFLGLHVYANYIKIAFFRGASLSPPPPDASKTAATRYLNLREGALDEQQFVAWVKQASALPGERM